MRSVLYGLAALAACAACSGRASADLVVNGGFETGNFSGWTTFGDTTFLDVVTFPVHSGNFAASMGPIGSIAGIFQNLATVAGQSYVIEFWLQSDGLTPNAFQFSWGGVLEENRTNIPSQGFTLETFTLTATSASTELRFGFRNDPGFLGFDDVSVNPVPVNAIPEPATLALAGLGALCLAPFARRKRATVAQA
jgi:hypothetical protein